MLGLLLILIAPFAGDQTLLLGATGVVVYTVEREIVAAIRYALLRRRIDAALKAAEVGA